MTGFINVNKAAGASSAQEVNRIKRIAGVSCGHMGTLDPMASGVLPVALGNAARLFDYFLQKRKTYIATFRFGVDSDTLDITGEMRENAGYVPTKEQIAEVLGEFTGEINQLPPKYSAKNIAGKRAYELARSGQEFELSPKKVNIYSLELVRQVSDDGFEFEIECGGGTYIRSIARDLGARLNTCAVMSALVRTKSGVFTLENTVCTEDITKDNLQNYIIPTQNVLPFESITPSGADAKRLFNGIALKCGYADGIYKIFNSDGTFYGLAEVIDSVLKVRTKLC